MRLAEREIDSPVGRLAAGAVDAGVCLLEFAGSGRDTRGRDELTRLLPPTPPTPATTLAEQHLDALTSALDAYFAGEPDALRTLPLIAPGTGFQRAVWDVMRSIPCGGTMTYGELATQIGSIGGARAVGAASGRNRIAIIIPCHRVVESGGGLRGYGGGLDRKRWLLDHERSMTGLGTLFEPPYGPVTSARSGEDSADGSMVTSHEASPGTQ